MTLLVIYSIKAGPGPQTGNGLEGRTDLDIICILPDKLNRLFWPDFKGVRIIPLAIDHWPKHFFSWSDVGDNLRVSSQLQIGKKDIITPVKIKNLPLYMGYQLVWPLLSQIIEKGQFPYFNISKFGEIQVYW